jgi:hypothetical protein
VGLLFARDKLHKEPGYVTGHSKSLVTAVCHPPTTPLIGKPKGRFAIVSVGYDHITNNTPVPVRSQKLNFVKLA